MRIPEPTIRTPDEEVSRVMQICNACRYCEGYCAVFPAMTRRLSFDGADAQYLANLCHSCGACLHACQYAAPHPFDVNVPRAMAQVRQTTYSMYAWPTALGALYRVNGLLLSLATSGAIAISLVLTCALRGSLAPAPPGGNFYAVFSHTTLTLTFGAAFGWALIAFSIGAVQFWRGQSPAPASGAAIAEAVENVLTLTYLDGGHGDGCNEEDDRFTPLRRLFHHFTFYGFLLCFAATVTATVYHYAMDRYAPYPVGSLPVLFGTLGGIGLLIGPAGLLWLNVRRHPLHGDPTQKPMDRAFMALLFGTGATGLSLLAWRATPAMAVLLAIHLGCVMALFLTLPYGKFAHAVYRSAALLKWAIERRQPNRVRLTEW